MHCGPKASLSLSLSPFKALGTDVTCAEFLQESLQATLLPSHHPLQYMYVYIYIYICLYDSAESMQGTVKTLTSTAASLSGILSGDYDKMKNKKVTPVESDKVKLEVGGMLVLEEGGSVRTQPPLAPTERVDENEESSLSKMLTELDLADKYLHKLESEGVDMNDLKETLERRGDSALERLLEQVGVEKAVHRHRIANHLVNKLN